MRTFLLIKTCRITSSESLLNIASAKEQKPDVFRTLFKQFPEKNIIFYYNFETN